MENKLSDNCINKCSRNVPFDDISSYKENNFIFIRNLPKSQKSTAKLCLKLIAFGMSLPLMKCEEKYSEYGEKDIKKKGLATVGYESDFLADLVSFYLFKNTTINSGESYVKVYTETMCF